MVQQIGFPQIELPPFLKELVRPELLAQMQPSEFLKVSLELTPRMTAVGAGQPLTAEGVVTIFGLPVPLPIPVILQATKRPEILAKPVAWGLTAPFVGTYSIRVPTDEWEYAEYGFQALAFLPVPPPGLSEPAIMGIEAPRYAATITFGVAGASSTLDIDKAGLPTTVYVNYTVGFVGTNREFLARINRRVYLPEHSVDAVEANDDYWVTLPLTPLVRTNMPLILGSAFYEGWYHALLYVKQMSGTVAAPGTVVNEDLAHDIKSDEIHLYLFPRYGATLSGVLWHL